MKESCCAFVWSSSPSSLTSLSPRFPHIGARQQYIRDIEINIILIVSSRHLHTQFVRFILGALATASRQLVYLMRACQWELIFIAAYRIF